MNQDRRFTTQRNWLILAFCIISFLLLAGGISLFVYENRSIRKAKYEELEAIAGLKIDQLVKWQNERIGDGMVLAGDSEIIDMLDSGPTPSTLRHQRLDIHLRLVKEAYGYQDVILVNTNGDVLMSVETDESRVDGETVNLIGQVVSSKKIAFSGFYRLQHSGTIAIDVLAPVLNSEDAVTGVMILREDPSKYLFPMIQSWPTPSKTSETLIVREDHGDVLFLNELRHRPDSALNLRIPLTRADLPAARAISGQTGQVEGPDYRGVPVMAAIRSVPETPWFMIAKVDKSELLAELAFRKIIIVMITILTLLLAAAITGAIFYYRQGYLYRSLLNTKRSLDEAREWFRTTLYSIGDGVITADMNRCILQMNAVAEKMTGWPETEARGKSLGEVFHIVNEETRQPVEDPLEKVFREGVVVGLANHTILISRNGAEYPIADSGAPIRTHKKEIQGGVLVFRDQTEERKNEKDLRDNERKLRLALQSANQEVFDVQVNFGESADIQENSGLPWGPSMEFLKTQGLWQQSIHPEDQDAAVVRLWEYLCGKTDEYRNEYRKKDESGEWRWILSRGGITERNSSGRLLRMTGTHMDVTEMKNLEDQYRQAQKMEAVGRLAGGIAHDFNNMLNVILGNAEMALGKLEKENPVAANLSEIRTAAVRSADLTRQLLGFARRQNIMPRVLDLNDVISSTEKILRRLIGEDVKLIFLPKNGLWSVKMDMSQVEQILMNLAVNARDAISGSGTISIETANAEFDEEYCAHHVGFRKGRYVMVAFSDSGEGMDHQTMERIFEPFFTTKAEGKGTGLGLSTVYGIIKQNDGFINVYSEPGMGSTFKMYLPYHEGIDEPRAPLRPLENLTGTETVLVVEDEKQILSLCCILLENLGYTPLAAETVEEAISISEKYSGTIHLLLTDVVMPGMNGKELQERIVSARPDIRTLFMSGYSTEAAFHKGIVPEGVLFINKPFSRNELAQKLREALD